MSDSSSQPEVTGRPIDGRGLTWLYVAALSTVAALSIGAQLLIQRQLSGGESDSRVINIAGRQRMLSQRLVKSALEQQSGGGEASREELATTLQLWSRSHQGLQHGDADAGLPGKSSPEIKRLYASIQGDFEAMQSAGRRLAEAKDVVAASDVKVIQRHEEAFLTGMDNIVSQYVIEAERKVVRLRRLESAILALTLGVLVAEGLLVFRPAVQRIDQTVKHLGTLSQRLRAAKEQAEEANAAKTRFLGNVSHELRTPITAVLGMNELAQREEDTIRRNEFLAIVEEAGQSLLGLLNDLIDLSRIDSGQLVLASEPFAPSKVVARVSRIMQSAASNRDLLLSDRSDLPVDLYVVGDARRLEQVLVNFVANAIKSTESGSVAIGCTLVRAGHDRAVLSYTVRDTGVGIDPGDQERIFEPFVQVRDGIANESSGAGLGLAICRRIAEAMDAKITVLSVKEVGTTVTLTAEFPIASKPNAAPQNTATLDSIPPLRLLVVDDTRVNRMLLKEMLASAGHEVALASDGETAIQLYREEPFEAVFIDWGLPGMDGRMTAEALEEIDRQQNRKPTPKICVTAHSRSSVTEADESGVFNAVVSKPFTRAELLQSLAEVRVDQQTVAVEKTFQPADQQDEAMIDDPELIEQLAHAYLETAASQRESLRRALDQQQLWDAKVLAHRFRGQIAYFGATQLAASLLDLEAACERGEKAAAERLGEPILGQLDALAEQLSQASNRPSA